MSADTLAKLPWFNKPVPVRLRDRETAAKAIYIVSPLCSVYR